MYLNLVLYYMDSKIRTVSAPLLRNSFDVGEKGFAYGYLPCYVTLRPPCIREYRYLWLRIEQFNIVIQLLRRECRYKDHFTAYKIEVHATGQPRSVTDGCLASIGRADSDVDTEARSHIRPFK
jgi:hypothetical protein